MFIAQKLKKENICEYLLYMWQIENLLRAFKFDMDIVNERIIAQFPIKNELHRKIIYEWYESLIEMMRLENVQTVGHLQINKNILIELDDFHELILKSGKVPAYNSKFYHILPFINQFKFITGNSDLSDIENCFNFQYGFMLLKMKESEISERIRQAQTEISKFMVLLAANYRQYVNGELNFDE